MDESGPVVQPAVPHFLDQIETEGRATRLDLARWVTVGNGPMTSRVFVNRLWYLFFGRGLSRSLDDLGAQGQPPDQPELLEALSAEFIRSGWDVKHVVRGVVMSRAYRQSSVPREADRPANPGNQWFGWQGRWRLPAETIRDNALAISGLLVEELGWG